MSQVRVVVDISARAPANALMRRVRQVGSSTSPWSTRQTRSDLPALTAAATAVAASGSVVKGIDDEGRDVDSSGDSEDAEARDTVRGRWVWAANDRRQSANRSGASAPTSTTTSTDSSLCLPRTGAGCRADHSA